MAENHDPSNNPNNLPPIANRPINQELGPRTRRYQIFAVISAVTFCVLFIIVFLFIIGVIPDASGFWYMIPLILCCNCGGGRRRQQEQQARQNIEREMGTARPQAQPLPKQARKADANANLCSYCDQKIEPNVRFCPHCGAQIPGR